jgi:hypothetical protein
MDRRLIIFKWRKKGCVLVILFLIIMLMVFLAFGYLMSVIDINNTFLFGILFFATMLGSGFILNVLISKIIFPEIGYIEIIDNKLAISINNKIMFYSKVDISKIEFSYKGDRQWSSKHNLFHAFKSRTRYLRKRNDEFNADKRFDKISINDIQYYVKVFRSMDKEIFYSIIEWIKQNNIEYVFNEIESLSEYDISKTTTNIGS